MRRALALLFFLPFVLSLHAQTSADVTIAGSTAGGIDAAAVGRPCSVQFLTTHTTTLDDGTHITQTQKRNFYRDNKGRTRTEMYPSSEMGAAAAQPLASVIYDPPNGRLVILNPRDKTASVMQVSEIQTEQPEQAAPAASANTAESDSSAGNHVVSSEAAKTQTSNEALDGQSFDGIYAEGTRTTVMYPAGSSLGNDKPLSAVTVRYVSSDLQLEVYTRVADPQNGETVTKIQRLDRTEPDPALFEIPQGYTISKNAGSGASGS
jgi:hypothetical protein